MVSGLFQQAQQVVGREAKKKLKQNLASNGPVQGTLSWLFSPGAKSSGYMNEMRNAFSREAKDISAQAGSRLKELQSMQGDLTGALAKQLGNEDTATSLMNRITSATGDERTKVLSEVGSDKLRGLISQNLDEMVDVQSAMNHIRDRQIFGLPNAAASYLTEGGLVKGAARVGVGAFAIDSLDRMRTGRGGPFTDRGRFDIAGIPFV